MNRPTPPRATSPRSTFAGISRPRTSRPRAVRLTPPSDKVLRTACLFGLALSPDTGAAVVPGPPPSLGPDALARSIDTELGPGQIALLSGPSGSGKSSALAALQRRLLARDPRSVVVAATDPARGPRSGSAVRRGASAAPHLGRAVVDLLDLPLDATLSCLARAGLADARLMVAPAHRLSEGERFRLALAIAVSRAVGRQPRASSTGPRSSGPISTGPRRARPGRAAAPPAPPSPPGPPSPWPVTLLVDEWCSTLDRVTAHGVSRAIARWVRAAGLRLVVATAHDDVAHWLAPDLHVVLSLANGAAPC